MKTIITALAAAVVIGCYDPVTVEYEYQSGLCGDLKHNGQYWIIELNQDYPIVDIFVRSGKGAQWLNTEDIGITLTRSFTGYALTDTAGIIRPEWGWTVTYCKNR